MSISNLPGIKKTLIYLRDCHNITITLPHPRNPAVSVNLTSLAKVGTRPFKKAIEGYQQEHLAKGLIDVIQQAAIKPIIHGTTIDLNHVLQGQHHQLAVVFDSFGGESGKGKTTDWLLRETGFDICVRHHGGPNCGYSIKTPKGKIELAMIPMGINVPGITNLLSNGSVVNPLLLRKELNFLTQVDLVTTDDGPRRLLISEKAHIIFPFHRLFREAQRAANSDGQFGGVGIGVGPAYTDKVGRQGIQIAEMLHDPTEAQRRLTKMCKDYNDRLAVLGSNFRFSPEQIFEEYVKSLEEFQADGMLIPNSSTYLRQAIYAGKRIMFQGVQGFWADMDHGFVPYHTSASILPGNITTYGAVNLQDIQYAGIEVYQVAKAYVTGNDCPTFPTKLDQESPVAKRLITQGGEYEPEDNYLRNGNYVLNPRLNPLRPNPVGWFDLVSFEYTRRICGSTQGVISKLDVLSGIEEIPVCIAYKIPTGSRLARNINVGEFEGELPHYKNAEPVYTTLSGWQTDISNAKDYGALPSNAKRYLEYISRLAKLPIGLVSVGPSNEQTFRIPIGAW